MTRLSAATATAAFVLFAALSARCEAADEVTGIRWRTIQDGMAESQQTGKPLLFFFTAEWCTPCHNLRTESFGSYKIARLVEENYVPVEVLDRRREEGKNRPEVEQLERQAKVNAFPTLVVIRVGGSKAVYIRGYAGMDKVLAFLQTARGDVERADRVRAR